MKGKRRIDSKLGKCKICRLSSPKYWQLMLNDIPLLICVPFAGYLELAGTQVLAATLVVTLVDLVSMLTYLAHDEDLSVRAPEIFEFA